MLMGVSGLCHVSGKTATMTRQHSTSKGFDGSMALIFGSQRGDRTLIDFANDFCVLLVLFS